MYVCEYFIFCFQRKIEKILSITLSYIDRDQGC